VGIVLGGSKRHSGMVGFYETMDFAQTEAVHAYINHRASVSLEEEEYSWWDHIRYWFWYYSARLGDAFPWLANAFRDANMSP